MLKWSLTGLLLVAGVTAAAAQSTYPNVVTKVTIDSSAHTVTFQAGPFDLKNMPPMDHGMMDMGAAHDTPVYHFNWPVQGWFRGFHLAVWDKNGKPLPHRLMHHIIMVNFDRRQLIYQAAERLMGAGTETDDASVPKSIGVPLSPGTDLGVYVAWHNDTGRDLDGVSFSITMLYSPSNLNPRPLNAMPVYFDANLTIGGSNSFDVPPGRSTKSYEFTMPISGRLLGVGGHLHDYGVEVRLEDAETGKLLTKVEAKRDSMGLVSGVSRHLFGVSGRGLKMEAGHKYRVVGVYNNTSGKFRKNGAMASIVGLFAPDHMSEWPKIDPNNTTFQKDLAALKSMGHPAHEGTGGMQHEGMKHN